MRFDVLTLFPDMFSGYLTQSLLHKAIQRDLVDVQLHNMRDWAGNKHQSVDDRPFGGGPGMVLKVEPVVACVEAVQKLPGGNPRSPALPAGHPSHVGDCDVGDCDVGRSTAPGQLVLLTPKGQRLNQPLVERMAGCDRLLLLCGRYEGFDQRVVDILNPLEVSVGDYILNGGEVAAMIVIDAVIRLIPGVLGDDQSPVDDSFSSGNRHLEWAQYTRPRVFRGHAVPEVLLSGDHQAIAKWRQEQSYQETLARRADLLDREPDDSSEAT